jgi:tetratricopeptide (TPR) repeat protein
MYNNDRTQSGYGLHIHRVKTIRAAAVVIMTVLLITIPFPLIARLRDRSRSERKELLRFWEDGAFNEVFNASKTALAAKPMDYFLLTIHGFAAYQMGISQINNLDTIAFIDECIQSLRKVLLLKNAADDGRVYYVLGKAYSYKGDNYAELAVKYLEKARGLSYSAADIPEYLGLAYAAIGDFRSSVEAFSRALDTPVTAENQPRAVSDALLLSIARSYLALEELETARAYLLRCIEVSPDSRSIMTARLLLAEVLFKTGDSEGAENQYIAILNEAGENAEAHFQLGELYTLRGDTTRARAEWRLAYKTDPAHAKARARLNM